MSCAGSSRKWVHQFKKKTLKGLWPQVVRNTAAVFKTRSNVWFMHVLGVCLWTGKRERKEAALFYMGTLNRLLQRLFVHAHICLHLWNACVLLWQPSQSLVLFFVSAPAFNRSGLCHINTVRKEDLLWAPALHFTQLLDCQAVKK